MEDGDATLVGIYGRSVHTGIAYEVFTMTVTPASRTGGAEPITATINKSTFITYVSNPASITVELVYTDMWSANPALYGITVTGTPVSGDAITVEYVRPDRGTITPSNPTSFISTGWNLYNSAVGYARVKKYSDEYNFIIDGDYTSLKFSETYDGIRQNLSALSNRFSVPSDGYVWVTGGNANNTCIYMTWSDWNRGYEGVWKAYEESVVDFSSYTDTVFPYGMCQVGSAADEIDFSLKRMIRRIGRTAYSESTIETLIGTGIVYEADTNYIYYVLAEPVVTEFEVSNVFTANDHGLEMVDGETAPLILTLYGENLVEKLQHDIPNQIAANSTAIAKLDSNTNSTNDILADALTSNTTRFFSGTGSSYTGTVPNGNYKYGTFMVNRRYGTKTVLAQSANNDIAINTYDGSSWTGWQELATKSDLTGDVSVQVRNISTQYIEERSGFTANRFGRLLLYRGYFNIKTQIPESTVWGTHGILSSPGYFSAVNIGTHSSYVMATSGDGKISASENIPTGYYYLIGSTWVDV